MADEIAEQPATLRRLLAALPHAKPQGATPATSADCPNAQGSAPLDPALRAALARAGRIAFAACGSSRHAAILGRYACLRLAHLPCEVEAAHELRALGPEVWRGIDLTVLLSQSGETQDTLEAAQLAEVAGVPALVLTNVVPSRLAAAGRWTWDMEAGTEQAVPATKSFLAQATACLHLALCAAEARDTGLGPTAAAARTERAATQAALLSLPEKVAALLAELDGPQTATLASAAIRVAGARAPVILGRGPAMAVAHETALKLREAAYLPAHPFATGEFKHGPLAMFEPARDVVVALLEHDHGPAGDPPEAKAGEPSAERSLANLRRLAALGAAPVVVAPEGHPHLAALHREVPEVLVLRTPAAPPCVWPLLAAVATQRLTLAAAQRRGIDVDRPRHLVKSIGVH